MQWNVFKSASCYHSVWCRACSGLVVLSLTGCFRTYCLYHTWYYGGLQVDDLYWYVPFCPCTIATHGWGGGWAGLLPQVDGLFMLALTLLQLTVLQITWQKTPNDLYPARHRPALHFSTDQSFLCLKYFPCTTLISEIHRSIVSRTLISEIHCSIVSQIWQFWWRHLVTPLSL